MCQQCLNLLQCFILFCYKNATFNLRDAKHGTFDFSKVEIPLKFAIYAKEV